MYIHTYIHTYIYTIAFSVPSINTKHHFRWVLVSATLTREGYRLPRRRWLIISTPVSLSSSLSSQSTRPITFILQERYTTILASAPFPVFNVDNLGMGLVMGLLTLKTGNGPGDEPSNIGKLGMSLGTRILLYHF